MEKTPEPRDLKTTYDSRTLVFSDFRGTLEGFRGEKTGSLMDEDGKVPDTTPFTHTTGETSSRTTEGTGQM